MSNLSKEEVYEIALDLILDFAESNIDYHEISSVYDGCEEDIIEIEGAVLDIIADLRNLVNFGDDLTDLRNNLGV